MTRRDPETTKAVILDAAIAEFSRHGYAGARTERIAAASGKNRAMIYTYFVSKELLYEAVVDRMTSAFTDAVPMDATDLPSYAVRLFDRHRAHPDPLRLATWDRLEQSGQGLRASAVQSTAAEKIKVLETAQTAGQVSARMSAAALLTSVSAFSRIQAAASLEQLTDAELDEVRAALRTAISALTRP